MDNKLFTPDSSWNPSGDAAIVAGRLLLEAVASYYEDFEGYSIGAVPADFSPYGATTFDVYDDGGNKVLRLTGTTWCMIYKNDQVFGPGMVEAKFSPMSNGRHLTVAQRVNPAARSGYASQFINTAGFYQIGSGVDGGYVADYPYYDDTQQASELARSLPVTVKHQLAEIGSGWVETQLFLDDEWVSTYVDRIKKYIGDRIAFGVIYIGGIDHVRFWPLKTGGFEKTFTPYSLTSWGRVSVVVQVGASRIKKYSELFEYRIDSGAWNPLPDDGDISGAPAGSSITIRANSTLMNDFNSSLDVSVESVSIEIDGQWDAFAAPTDVDANATSARGARVTWTDSVEPGVAYYRIYKNTTSDFATAELCGFSLQGSGYCDVYGLDPSTQYWFWVVGVKQDGSTSIPGGPDDATTSASNVAFDLSAIQQVLYEWATRVTGGQAIFEYEAGTKPGKPFVSINVVGPMKPGFTDSVRGKNTGDKDFEQSGQRKFMVSINVYDDLDAITWAQALQSSLDNPVEIAYFREADIGLGDAGDVNDLTEVLDTKYERRAQFDFTIFYATNIPFTDEIIETVDYQNNL